MADSPEKDSEGVIKLTVYSNGTKLEDTVQIVNVQVEKAVNVIPVARLVVLDGDMPSQDFPLSNADSFKPGTEIKIAAGYRDQEETLFEGIVVKHSMKITGENYSRLLIECRDKAVAMTIGRKNANYVDSKDSDVFSTLIGNCSGLSADVTATDTQHAELVQYYCTDWDFLLSRAEVNGSLVIVDDAKVTVAPPDTSSSAVLAVGYGIDLMEFHAEIDARSQFSQVTGACWDPSTHEVVEQVAGVETLNSQGNLSGSDLAEVLGVSSFQLQTPVTMESSALKEWAHSQQVKAGLSRIRGRMRFQGSAKAKPGTLIELSGVGERFNGDVFVSAVAHEIVDGNWTTDVEFGMSPQWFAERRDLTAPPAAGLVPGVEGLHIGIVMKLDGDPEEQNRIQVKVPVLQTETQGVWARLATFYASSGFGEFFIPEIGDEVILGYLNNDPAHPVILGSVYSAKHAPPYELAAENNIKAVVTRSNLKLEFDDENKVITVTTPAGNKIVVSDQDESILIQDQTDNKVELSTSGINIESPKDIKITATGKMALTSTGEMSLSSSADLKASGLNIEASADIGMTAKGGASAEVSAGGNTTIKGTMVMIN
jgi:Rhs element Vgr protein